MAAVRPDEANIERHLHEYLNRPIAQGRRMQQAVARIRAPGRVAPRRSGPPPPLHPRDEVLQLMVDRGLINEASRQHFAARLPEGVAVARGPRFGDDLDHLDRPPRDDLPRLDGPFHNAKIPGLVAAEPVDYNDPQFGVMPMNNPVDEDAVDEGRPG